MTISRSIYCAGNGEIWTWQKWADIIKNNFDRCFYVADDDPSQYVNKRGIIKDTYGSTHGFTDYQLRPNFPIAIAVVSLLITQHSREYIKNWFWRCEYSMIVWTLFTTLYNFQAPRLISPDKAWRALEVAEKELLGPLGIKTLDPRCCWNNPKFLNFRQNLKKIFAKH